MSKTLLARGTKAINITVVTATMLWSSGVASVLPVAAETVTLKDGDLIKSTTAPDVYWYSGGKRSPFPNLATFNSWGLSFKNVVKMAQTDMNKIDLSGSNVTYRPCTRLIKIMTDPKTYAVSPSGTLHWIQTEDAAKAYFGDTWNKKIDDVADVFFTNYTKGDNLADASKAIPGCFLRDAGSGDTFYINEDGSKSKVDAAGLAANNVNTSYVLTASGTQLSGAAASTTKPTISAADTSLMMYAPKGSGTTTTPTSPTTSTGTGLTVSLASDTPATTSILVGTGTVGAQALVDMVKLKLTASNDGDIKVSTLKLKRTGVASDSDVNNAYLYANGTRLAEMQSVSNGVLTFAGAPLFTVTKGSALDLWVKMDLSTAATSGKTIGFSLNAATDVDAGTGVTISGTFPQSGNLMSVASVADLGRLTVANVSPTAAITADAQDGYEAWRFSLNAGNQDILVSYLAMTNTGTTSGDDLQNFKLYDGATQLGSTVAKLDSAKMVAFDLSAAPFKITAGQTKQITLKLDIKSGAGRTFQFSFQKPSDVKSKDNNYGVWLFPFPNGGTAGVWTVVRSHTATTATTINSGTLSVSKTSDSPSGNIAINGTNVTLGKFEFKAAGEDIKVNNLMVRATVGGAGSVKTLRNVKIFSDGTQVGTTITTLTSLTNNTVATDVAGDANDVTVTLGNSLVVPAGKSKMITLVADLTGTGVATDAVVVGFAGSATIANAQGTLSLTSVNVPGAPVAGNSLTLGAGSLSGALNSSLASMTVVKGATTQMVGSAIVTAGTAEGVDVTSLTITDSAGTAGEALGHAFTNVKLYNGTTQLGSTYVNPGTSAGSSMTFTISPALSLAANGSAQIDIKADILSGEDITGDNGIIQVSAASGTGKSTATTVSLTAAANLQTFTIVAGGTLTVSLDPSTPQDQQVVMASTGNLLGAWKFQASLAEDLTVNQLVFIDNSADANSVRNVKNLKLYADGMQVGNTVPSLSNLTNTTNTAVTNGASATIIKLGADASATDSFYVGYYIAFLTNSTAGNDIGKIGRITAYTGATQLATVTPVGAAFTNEDHAGATYKVISAAVFTGIGKTVASNNFKILSLKGDVSDVNNATVALRNRFTLGTIATMTGAGTDTIIAQGASSGAYATLANTNTAYQANNSYAYRTKLVVATNSASPSGTGKVRGAGDTLIKMDFTTNAAYETQLRAAGIYLTLDGDQANWVGNGAANTGFTSATAAAAAGIAGTAATAVRFTEGSGSTNAAFAMRTLTTPAFNSYNYVSFWINSSAAKAAADLAIITNDSADKVSPTSTHNLPALAAARWTYVRLDLRNASAGATNATDTRFGLTVLANGDNDATIDLDEVMFHNDFLTLNVNAGTFLASANAIPLTLSKTVGTQTVTAATGYVHNNNNAATPNTVTFVPTPTQGNMTISTSNPTVTLSVTADTTVLLAAGTSVKVTLSTGSSASTVASYPTATALTGNYPVTPSGLAWYDGSVSTSVFWTDAGLAGNTLEGGNLTYTN